MAVSYKKLWHILVDRNMKKKDLEEAAGITHYQMYKLANDKDITTDVMVRFVLPLRWNQTILWILYLISKSD